MISSPGPPKLGRPESYFHGVWFAAKEDEPIESYVNWMRRAAPSDAFESTVTAGLRPFSHARDNWRDKMPESSLPPVEVINGIRNSPREKS